MKTRTQVINELIKENGFQSYLEIGLGNGVNFDRIKCGSKVGVDPKWPFSEKDVKDGQNILPLESNEFFEDQTYKFDLIFIDGDHDGFQVEKDIVNSWNCLNKGGIILLHDINPPTKESQLVPKKSSPWKGTVWRAFVGFMEKYPKIESYTTKHDTGLGWIYKSRHKVETGFYSDSLTYEEFDSNREELLKIRQ